MPSLLAVGFLVVVTSVRVQAKQLQIVVRDNVTRPCPNVKSDIVDMKSLKFSFSPVTDPQTHGKAGDEVTVVMQDGQSQTLRFPGCYRVQLSFRMKQTFENPYVEAFLQMGANIPCQSDQQPFGSAPNICANISATNWCPQSTHSQLRTMLEGKDTCRFCNLCNTLESVEPVLSKYVKSEAGSEKECHTDKQQQTLSFKMCTPDKRELRKANEDNEGKLEDYWKYLKQGVLTAVVHVLDRPQFPSLKLQQCARMCQTYEDNVSRSASYRRSLLTTIEKMCLPKDTYAACVYHTVKFDVLGEFV